MLRAVQDKILTEKNVRGIQFVLSVDYRIVNNIASNKRLELITMLKNCRKLNGQLLQSCRCTLVTCSKIPHIEHLLFSKNSFFS